MVQISGSLGIEWDDTYFRKSLEGIEAQAKKDDQKIVVDNARTVLVDIVNKTPKASGHARAAFYPAWVGLGLPGAPKTSAGYGKRTVQVWKTVTKNGRQYRFLATVTYFVEGIFEDYLHIENNPSITFANLVKVETKAGRIREKIKDERAAGKGERGERRQKRQARIKAMRERVKGQSSKFSYLRAINAGTLKDDAGDPVGQDDKGFFTDTIKEHKIEFKDYYKKNFKKHSR